MQGTDLRSHILKRYGSLWHWGAVAPEALLQLQPCSPIQKQGSRGQSVMQDMR